MTNDYVEVQGTRIEMEGKITTTNDITKQLNIEGDIPFMTIGFKHGDIVRLKSGGHEMVVERIEKGADRVIHCVWMNENMEVCRSYFNPVTLEYAVPVYNPYALVLTELRNYIIDSIEQRLARKDTKMYFEPYDNVTNNELNILYRIKHHMEQFMEDHDLADKE